MKMDAPTTIKEICEKFQTSPDQLSLRFDIPLRTVQGWYYGERKPPNYLLKMIEEILRRDEGKNE